MQSRVIPSFCKVAAIKRELGGYFCFSEFILVAIPSGFSRHKYHKNKHRASFSESNCFPACCRGFVGFLWRRSDIARSEKVEVDLAGAKTLPESAGRCPLVAVEIPEQARQRGLKTGRRNLKPTDSATYTIDRFGYAHFRLRLSNARASSALRSVCTKGSHQKPLSGQRDLRGRDPERCSYVHRSLGLFLSRTQPVVHHVERVGHRVIREIAVHDVASGDERPQLAITRYNELTHCPLIFIR